MGRTSKILLFITSLLLFLSVIGISIFIYSRPENVKKENSNGSIDSFDECVAAGYAIMESYPRQCGVPDGETFTEKIESSDGTGLANPASVYCVDQGGTLEIRDEEEGQVGYCMFNDGSECEEWAFYTGECVK